MKVESNGCALHVRLDGPDDAPVIMLSHGIATDLGIWDGLVPHLVPTHRVLRYDSRGHGASAAIPGAYSLALLADDVVGILDALNISAVHFAGLSMGGMVGLELAVRAPARMMSIAVCDARGTAPPSYREAWAQRSRQARDGGMETMVESSVSRWFTPHFLAHRPAEVEGMRDSIRRTSVDGYCGSAAALCELDHEIHLAAVRVPLLFLTGAQDQGAPPDVVRAMHAKAPGSTYVELPDAGHISVMEQPRLFADALLGFIAAADSAQAKQIPRARA
ncbi:alpha/beta fold hydrolase [Aquabacter spiritensis]|uniref:3-oxoadipate enol-lactonase n=1 Tax=Aquabacter spiritensis TaxID=933073 RepID=A0A4R3M7Q9_9HYPH|nr:alpha/beta fold hydrolase [Aquabacter spiritensis]TCT08319.1 3-oxoadipate enol-lactonase [Aquabacter spiritensis]